MFFFKNKRSDGGDPANPAWLKWLVVGFIIYVGYTQYQKNSAIERGEVVESETAQRVGSSITIAGSQVKYPNRTSGAISSEMVIGGDIKGSGAPASCGEKAHISADINFSEGTAISAEQKTEISQILGIEQAKTSEVFIGDKSDKRIWSKGITGMSSNGIREIIVSANSVLNSDELEKFNLADSSKIHYQVKLTQLEPTIDSGKLQFRATDIVRGKTTDIAFCSDDVGIHIDIWAPSGERIFSSRPQGADGVLNMTVGSSKYFYGLDRGVLGMRRGGMRSLIVPSEYFMSSSATALPEQAGDNSNNAETDDKTGGENEILEKINQYPMVIVDLSLVSVKKTDK